jgi:hypothetical protein
LIRFPLHCATVILHIVRILLRLWEPHVHRERGLELWFMQAAVQIRRYQTQAIEWWGFKARGVQSFCYEVVLALLNFQTICFYFFQEFCPLPTPCVCVCVCVCLFVCLFVCLWFSD